jgi:hypothetical protein
VNYIDYFRPCLVFFNSENIDHDTFKEDLQRKLLLQQYEIPIELVDISDSSNNNILEEYGIKKSENPIYVIEHGSIVQQFSDFDSYLNTLHEIMRRS